MEVLRARGRRRGGWVSLAGNLRRLTEPHMELVEGTIVSSISLLDRLELAIQPTPSGKAGGSSGVQIPINAVAMSLWQDIDREARDHDAAMGKGARGKLRDLLRGWVTPDMPDDWQYFLEHVTLDWCDAIEAQLNPGKPYQPFAPCPHCDERFVGEERAPVLSVYYLGEGGNILDGELWTMTCGACETTWAGQEVQTLSDAMREAA